jgi:hypothetical protein
LQHRGCRCFCRRRLGIEGAGTGAGLQPQKDKQQPGGKTITVMNFYQGMDALRRTKRKVKQYLINSQKWF